MQALREGVHALRTGKDASGTLLADPEKYPGVLGAVAALVSVDAGAQEAIAAALGGAADAVAVTGLDAAVAILEALKGEDAGSAGLVITPGPADDRIRPEPRPRSPTADCRRASGCRTAPIPPSGWCGPRTGWRPRWLACCPASWWPPTWPRPGNWSAPTRSCGWSPGRATCSARTGPQAARPGPPASSPCAAWPTRRRPGWRPWKSAASRPPSSSRWPLQAEDQARQVVAKAQAALREVDAAAAEVSGRLGRLAGAARAARDEAQRLEAAIDQAHRAHEASQASVAELELSLAEAEARAGRGRAAPG